MDTELEVALLAIGVHELFFDPLRLVLREGALKRLVDGAAFEAGVELERALAQQLLACQVGLLDAGAVDINVAQLTIHDRVALAHVVERALQATLAGLALGLRFQTLGLVAQQDQPRWAATEGRQVAAALDQ